MAVEVMAKILANPRVDHKVEHVIEKTCRGLPAQYRAKVSITFFIDKIRLSL